MVSTVFALLAGLALGLAGYCDAQGESGQARGFVIIAALMGTAWIGMALA